MARLAISSARVDSETGNCTTCGRPVFAPYRRYNERGEVLEGCVDGSHTGHLTVPSESARWHNREVAERIRRNMLHTLRSTNAA